MSCNSNKKVENKININNKLELSFFQEVYLDSSRFNNDRIVILQHKNHSNCFLYVGEQVYADDIYEQIHLKGKLKLLIRDTIDEYEYGIFNDSLNKGLAMIIFESTKYDNLINEFEILNKNYGIQIEGVYANNECYKDFIQAMSNITNR